MLDAVGVTSRVAFQHVSCSLPEHAPMLCAGSSGERWHGSGSFTTYCLLSPDLDDIQYPDISTISPCSLLCPSPLHSTHAAFTFYTAAPHLPGVRVRGRSTPQLHTGQAAGAAPPRGPVAGRRHARALHGLPDVQCLPQLSRARYVGMFEADMDARLCG